MPHPSVVTRHAEAGLRLLITGAMATIARHHQKEHGGEIDEAGMNAAAVDLINELTEQLLEWNMAGASWPRKAQSLIAHMQEEVARGRADNARALIIAQLLREHDLLDDEELD